MTFEIRIAQNGEYVVTDHVARQYTANYLLVFRTIEELQTWLTIRLEAEAK